ncbi:MAG: CdaR family protein [Lachnospiraceae bacterium]|nr:CdaR family protein [Lachnospiraceae bacterium]
MKNKIIKAVTENVWLKVISLAVAFLIWMLVTNTNNPVRPVLFSNVPITIVNQDSIADIGKVVEAQGSGTVTVKVTERRSVVERLAKNGSDFYVEADLENINEMDTVPLTVTCSSPSVTWDEIEISPSSLKVKLEDKIEQPFIVSVSTSGSPDNGYAVGTTEVVEGKNISIAGPRSVMRIINQVVASVDVSGVGENTTLTAVLRVIDKNGSELDASQLSNLEFKDSNGKLLTDRKVQVKINLWKIRTDIPIYVETTGTPAFGYQVAGIETIPVSISLAGTDEALKNLGGKLVVKTPISVAGASENISQEIDLTETLEELEGLKLMTDVEPNIMVEVKIEKTGDTTLSIPLGEVELLNKPAGMNLVFTPADKISVSIHAADGETEKLSSEDIRLSIDLSVCSEEGNHELPVDVQLPDGYELASEVTIVVNSEKQEVETETELIP